MYFSCALSSELLSIRIVDNASLSTPSVLRWLLPTYTFDLHRSASSLPGHTAASEIGYVADNKYPLTGRVPPSFGSVKDITLCYQGIRGDSRTVVVSMLNRVVSVQNDRTKQLAPIIRTRSKKPERYKAYRVRYCNIFGLHAH